jgi:membrane-bound lytic murein transglycosylase B
MTFKFAPLALPDAFKPHSFASVVSRAVVVFALGGLVAANAFAQSQPQTPTQQGQIFEEEIVPQRYANNPNVDAFINDMVARYDFDSSALHDLFNRVSYSATAVKLVLPAPTPSVKNWRVYQSRFIEPVRINAGVKFWRANQATLQRASEQFGVPPEVIVGIIGVETIYGKYMGNFRALDALTTLTFDYPNTPNRVERMATFRKNRKSTRRPCSVRTPARSAFRSSCRAASCNTRSISTATAASICARARRTPSAAWRIT